MNHWASHEGDIRRATMNGHQAIHKRLIPHYIYMDGIFFFAVLRHQPHRERRAFAHAVAVRLDGAATVAQDGLYDR